MTCYDLINVVIKKEQVQARPIAWDREIYDTDGNDVKGEPVEAVEFHTTCPYCGDLIHFAKDEILWIAENDQPEGNVQCEECGAGKKLEISEDGTPQPRQISAVQVEFLDPIAEGLFDVEIDQELFEKVEELAKLD